MHLEYYGDGPVKRYGNIKQNMKRVLLGILSKNYIIILKVVTGI